MSAARVPEAANDDIVLYGHEMCIVSPSRMSCVPLIKD